ncbi:MAG: transglycosylase SLT domain-containing protein [Pseudomonadota bacterium]
MKMHAGAFAVLAIAIALAAGGQAGAAEIDLAYRADQASFRMPEAAVKAQLPRLLDEYAPPPTPVSVAAEPAAAAPEPFAYAWDRVRAGFALPALEVPLVAHWQTWYLERPALLQAMFARGRRYIYHVVEEIDKRKLPTELAFLPMVESGYNPMALSSAQASGLWQFIPSTGKAHDLKQGLLMDARRDIIASTAAALTYLQTLFERFGDWQLALAAYNSGETGVARAIARNKAKGQATDYKSLDLPEETRNYLPKLQALKNIVSNPSAFNFQIDPVPNKPYFAAIASERYLDVDVAARLADVTLEEFLALNPSFNLNLISKGPRARILLPVDKIEAFIGKLDNYKEPPKRAKPADSKPSSTPKARADSGERSAR